jgi:alpha(1,3/1,4) fucosyltransferase
MSTGKLVKATLFVREHPCLIGDAIFSGAPMDGMKSDAFMFIELRRLLAQQGIALATQDIHPPVDSVFVLCVDNALPFQRMPKPAGQPWYLLLSEPATYHPHNYMPENQRVFDRIFTYDYTLVDNERYFLYRFAIDFESYPTFESVTEAEFSRRKLCALVAASFGVSKPPANSGSLLHERYAVLAWFSEHHPEEFDFFSRGIDIKELQSFRGAGLLRQVLPTRFFTWLGNRRRRVFDRVYRGPIPPDDKISRLRDYRFAVAYENTGNVPGYLTEKIFDCFAAAVVPIYLGDPNVAQAIPAACFIDRRDFSSHEALYDHLKRMTYAQYMVHVQAIEQYLAGSGPATLTSAANAQAIADLALADQKR